MIRTAQGMKEKPWTTPEVDQLADHGAGVRRKLIAGGEGRQRAKSVPAQQREQADVAAIT